MKRLRRILAFKEGSLFKRDKANRRNQPTFSGACALRIRDWSSLKITSKARWSIEVYHRELKQTCGIERCQARTGRAQRNHIFIAISAWL